MGDPPLSRAAQQFAAADEATVRDLAERTIRGRGQRILAGAGTVQAAAGASAQRRNAIAREAGFGLRDMLQSAASDTERRRIVSRALTALDNDPTFLREIRNRGRAVTGQRQLAGS